jgi:TRAP-type C4-dicarboxylate transport system permease small subunit
MGFDGNHRFLLALFGFLFMIVGVLLWSEIAQNASDAGGLGMEWNVLLMPIFPFLLGLVMMILAFTNRGGSS